MQKSAKETFDDFSEKLQRPEDRCQGGNQK